MKKILIALTAMASMLFVGCSSDEEYFEEDGFTIENMEKNTTTFFVNLSQDMNKDLEHKFVCIDSEDELTKLNLTESVKTEIMAKCGKSFDWSTQSLVITRFTNPFATDTNVDVYRKDDHYRFDVRLVGYFRAQAFWHVMMVGVVNAKGLKAENMSATLSDSQDTNFKPVAW